MDSTPAFAFLLLLVGGTCVLLRTHVASWLEALRAPIILWVVLTIIPTLAILDQSLARGLFWVSRGGAFGLSTLAFLAGWECLFIERLIRCYGPQRFPGYSAAVRNPPALWEYVACAIPGIVAAAAIYHISGSSFSSESLAWLTAGVLGGFGFAVALVLAAIYVQLWTSAIKMPLLQMMPDFSFFDRARRATPPAWLGRPAELISRGLRYLIRWAAPDGAGYLIGGKILADGHVASAVMLFLSTVIAGVYFAGYHLEFGWLRPGHVPAAVYLYLSLTILGWTISALCFLLDGYRVPTLAVLAAWAWLVTFNPMNQHYFEINPDHTSIPLATPYSVGAAHEKSGERRWIIVSADGGGIQASAWTAQVLGGLTRELGAPFGESIIMMSGVSGGSAGLMYFDTLYDKSGFHYDNKKIEEVVQESREPGLSDVAFGMTFYDLSRPFIPYVLFGKNDRGVLLERAWQRHLETLGMNPDITLADLREGVVDGRRPVLLFNSTVADSGQAFVLSNGQFPLHLPGLGGGSESFEHLYPGKDMRLVTAVRMSATFPFVSPAARASESHRPYRAAAFAFVDGGYYDNYGVVNALAWLRAAVAAPAGTTPLAETKPPKVIWLQIRCSQEPGSAKADSLASSGVGPILTLYQTRGTAQRSRQDN